MTKSKEIADLIGGDIAAHILSQEAEIEMLTIAHQAARTTMLEAVAKLKQTTAERDQARAEIERLKQQKETMRLDYKELEIQLTQDENIERDRDQARDALRVCVEALEWASKRIDAKARHQAAEGDAELYRLAEMDAAIQKAKEAL